MWIFGFYSIPSIPLNKSLLTQSYVRERIQNKTRKNAIVEYLDYQIPVTGTKGKWRYASSKAR